MPLVTVVIPSYNHAAFLPECLDSILAQTFTDWQALVIDDGSRDDSVAVAERYARADQRISVFSNPENLGTYGTEARGLGMAESPFVAIMNSDDVWAAEKLAVQTRQLEENPEICLSYCLGNLIASDGSAIPGDVHSDWPKTPVQRPLDRLVYENRILASGVVWRRESVRFETSLRYSGDWVALLEACSRSPFGCIAEPLAFWRQHPHNSYLLSSRQAAEEIRVREAIAVRAGELAHIEGVKPGLAQNALNLAALYALFHEPGRARRSLAQGIRFHPGRAALWRRVAASFLPVGAFRSRLWPGVPDGPDWKNLGRVSELSLRLG
ncbi:MAG: glycosyltransferase family 2 protein [Armatimonadetes bacterium]|nr:glycosyltransferase family 2 protein [Armatimonadota bacterium]MBS1711410.1 glycosyltransferase family 2 protein [Armatimonadota bacterium]MBX3107665.1 glycosyltransferase family 2 protein [Fimbriimonadaceae bacterium]